MSRSTVTKRLIGGYKHHLDDAIVQRVELVGYEGKSDRLLDRSTSPCIQITHQALAQLLGVRREAVTLTLRTLVERHEVALQRGVVEVIDRPALEARSCECYWTGEQKVRPPSLSAANVIVTVADPALKMRVSAPLSHEGRQHTLRADDKGAGCTVSAPDSPP